MTAMLSVLAVLLSALWYYRTAQARGLPGLAWAITGVIVYYAGFLFWMYLVLKTLMQGYFQSHGFWIGMGMDFSAILFGAAGVAFFRAGVLLKQGPAGKA